LTQSAFFLKKTVVSRSRGLNVGQCALRDRSIVLLTDEGEEKKIQVSITW